MNALTPEAPLDAAHIERQIVERDRQVDNAYTKDAQVAAIRVARRYRGDRLTKRAFPLHRILDPKHGPLVAVRLRVLSRKTLGGLHTDLRGRVLGAVGLAGARAVRRGRGRRVRRRWGARVPRARGDVRRGLPVLRENGRARCRCGPVSRGDRPPTPPGEVGRRGPRLGAPAPSCRCAGTATSGATGSPARSRSPAPSSPPWRCRCSSTG